MNLLSLSMMTMTMLSLDLALQMMRHYTLILSHINYGITAWSSAGVSAKNRLHIGLLQKRALRAVSHSEFRSHSNPHFIKYNQLKIDDLCKLNIGTFMYKYCNNLLPSTSNLLFKTNSENHSYTTCRFATNFNIPKNKLEFGKKSISYKSRCQNLE